MQIVCVMNTQSSGALTMASLERGVKPKAMARNAALRSRTSSANLGGMEEPTVPPTVGKVVGQNLQRVRKARRLTQERAAVLLVRAGLNWKRTHVSDLESGRRETLDAGTLVVLAAAWDLAVSDLFAGEGEVLLTPRADYAESWATAPRKELRRWFKGELPDDRQPDAGLLVGGARSVTLGLHEDAEEALADRLGVDVRKVTEAAEELWGSSLTEERDRRVTALGDLPMAERQAKQGHITRNLTAVLTRWITADAGESDG